MFDTKALKQRLKQIRKDANLNQIEMRTLCRKAGISFHVSSLSDWENVKSPRYPRPDYIGFLSFRFSRPLRWIFFGQPPPFSIPPDKQTELEIQQTLENIDDDQVFRYMIRYLKKQGTLRTYIMHVLLEHDELRRDLSLYSQIIAKERALCE